MLSAEQMLVKDNAPVQVDEEYWINYKTKNDDSIG